MMLSEKPRSPVVSEHRKVTKSAMEKKRRARINSSLTELKTILAGIMAYKEERFEKMEKADILEMTVNYVRQLQNKSSDTDSPVSNREGDDYRTGVNSCIGEVIRYVTASEICDTETKTKLLDHLANKVNNLSTAAKSTCLHSPVNNKTTIMNTTMSMSPDANNNVKDVPVFKQTTPISVFTTTQTPMNSVQTINTYTPQVTSPVNSIQTALTVPNVQNVGQIGQTSPQLMSNMPLTILVPANFCTTTSGTTCVIPVTWSNSGSESSVVVNPNSCPVELTDNVKTINSDTNNTNHKCDSEEERKRLGVSNSKHTNDSSINTNVTVNCVRSQQTDNEMRTLSNNSPYVEANVLREKAISGLVERVSENIPMSPTVPELSHSEYSVFQKYESRKAPSPFHRVNSMWRPW